MTDAEIRETLALSPRQAAAIIMDNFYFKRRFYRRVRGDAYFFVVAPTLNIPATVLEQIPKPVALAVAQKALRDELLVEFGQAEVEMTDWGVKNFQIKEVYGQDWMYLHLFVEPGYLDRSGRLRPGVDPREIPRLLVRLIQIKGRLYDELRRFAAVVARPAWWRDMGIVGDSRKQDWSPRED